jgi:hypothetical protein
MCEFCGYVLDDQRRQAMEQAARRRAMAAAAPVAGAAPMPAPSSFGTPYRSIDLGQVLSETFSLFIANIVTFAVIVALALSPAIAALVFAIVTVSSVRGFNPAVLLWFLAPYALALVTMPIATGALTFSVIQQKRGRHPSLGECLSVGLSRLPTLLGIGFVSGVALLGGFALCILPGFFVQTILCASTSIAVAERSGTFDSLSRSVSLTEGYRWPVFGVLLVISILGWVVERIPNLIATALPHNEIISWMMLATTISLLVLSFGLHATAQALIYYHLRVAKESIDANELAAVFD